MNPDEYTITTERRRLDVMAIVLLAARFMPGGRHGFRQSV